MENTYLIKRSVEKDGLPKKIGSYLVVSNLLEFEVKNWNGKVWSASKSINDDITHWYEPITLLEVIEERMPSDEEKHSAYIRLCNQNTFDFFKMYDNWIKTKLTKG